MEGEVAFHQLKMRSRSRKLLLDGFEVVEMHGLRCFEHGQRPTSDSCVMSVAIQFCNDFLLTLYVPFP